MDGMGSEGLAILAEAKREWEMIESVLKVADRVLLYGIPGTGKTTAAFMVDPKRTYKITMTEETPAAELLGFYMPQGDHFEFNYGVAARAWREGARLLVDEIDRASGDAQTAMYAIADDPMVAKLTLPNGETIKPRKGFQVVCTMNGLPEDLPDALKDRFSVAFNVRYPHPKSIEALPVNLREPAITTSIHVRGERRITSRQWHAYADLIGKGVEGQTAAHAVFNHRADEVSGMLRLREAAGTVA